MDHDQSKEKKSELRKGNEQQDVNREKGKDQGYKKSFYIEAPSINLPKGGGALKSIDEKFSVNPSNGTSSFAIPVSLSDGRNGFGPSLSLQYNSGTGNSIFGIGWDVQLPSIQRKTDKHLPEYNDAEETDTFLIAGSEDLVPVLVENTVTNKWEPVTKTKGNYFITEYRPRIESAFSRIEKIQRLNESFFYWKVTDRNNTVTFFGRSDTHRISHPKRYAQEPERVFKWLPEISFDDKGNLMQYEYKKENTQQIVWGVHERNRNDQNISNKHIKKIHYANQVPFYPGYIANKNDYAEIYDTTVAPGVIFLLSVVFDFGEHTGNLIGETSQWRTRPDPFSNYNSGFDMRTYRRCDRILMFHNFAELGAQPTLVHSLDLTYTSSSTGADQFSELSYLTSVTKTGFKVIGGVLTSNSFPPMEFKYQLLKWNKKIRNMRKADLVHAPVGISGNYKWVDLWYEGISGILTEQADGLYYKSNLGQRDDGSGPEFTEAMKVSPKPSLNGHATGVLQLTDLDADGKKQVVVSNNGMKGYFEIESEGKWCDYRSMPYTHNVDTGNPNLKFIDLNGDGRPDLLISEENIFTWYPSAGRMGYHAAKTTRKSFDEEKGPAILFADGEQTIYTADMTGDGIADIVRIRNNDISYWPNLGYGKFGSKVTMGNAPTFDVPGKFNPSLLQLVDISGTGATDLIYVGKDIFRAWINLGGNSWSREEIIYPFPSAAPPVSVAVADLMGNGTPCIIWSSSLQKDASAPMRYIDLMGGKKPHLLISYSNNLGKSTKITYKNSTSFYTADKRAGDHWITKLPFPVQCVTRVEIEEKITNTKFVNEYSYHHGYYDHTEREFRGFGKVIQTDTEEYEQWKRQDASNVTDERLHQDPVQTISWFHTGCFFGRENILQQLKASYYKNAFFNEYPVPDAFIDTSVIARDLTPREVREAIRSCKGMLMRKEIYSLDRSGKDELPYTVEQQNCHIKILQPVNGKRFGVFLVQPSEAITYHYERSDRDPRIGHNITLQIDEYGNVCKSASVVYKRQIADAAASQLVQDEQDRSWIKVTENNYTNHIINDINRPEAYRPGQLAETITWQLTGINKNAGQFFSLEEMRSAFNSASEIPFQQFISVGLRKRKVEHVRHLFLKNDAVTPLPLFQQESIGLGYQGYKLTFTDGLVQQAYIRNGVQLLADSELTAGNFQKSLFYKTGSPQPLTAGLFPLTDPDDEWWALSGTHGYPVNPSAAFYIPDKYIDPFSNITSVKFDPTYHLHVIETQDALGCKTSVTTFDYRVLMPQRVTDINDNISEVRFDIMGLVAGVAMMGKGADADDLTGFNEDLTAAQVANFLADPVANASALLKNATSRFVYDFTQFTTSLGVKPVVVANIGRETHFNMAGGAASKVQIGFEYSDGCGHVIMKKHQAEPGYAKQLVLSGGLLQVVEVDTGTALRWTSEGRSVFNNKGNLIRKYESFFSVTHRYEDSKDLVEIGISPVYTYDPLDRLIKIELPNGTFSSVEFDVWMEKKWDANDNVIGSKWYTDRISGAMGAKELEAARKAAVHDSTPSTIYFDTLGRSFYTIDHNRWGDISNPASITDVYAHTYTVLDIEDNPLKIFDPRNVKELLLGNPANPVMENTYDISGKGIHVKGMDNGEHWTFCDCAGKALFGWDSKDNRFTTTYDGMNRPLQHKVLLPARPAEGIPAREITFDRTVYAPNTNANRLNNLNGHPVQKYDGAGKINFDSYDFKGNVLSVTREFTAAYDRHPDWTVIAAVGLQGVSYTTQKSYDALNRAVLIGSADGSITRPVYSESGLVNEIYVSIGGGAEQRMINNIDHDAKGQRQSIAYNNNTLTEYKYDPLSYRLTQMTVTRTTDNKVLQDLLYSYDPIGNITSIRDNAIQTIYFNDSIIKPHGDFQYDALYRLIQSSGREHTSAQQVPDYSDVFRRNIPLPVDELAMQNYAEYYSYDESGNMTEMIHHGGRGSLIQRWTRQFNYITSSNQLQSMTIGATTQSYNYDEHGCLLNMEHLNLMNWDFENKLESIDKGGGGKVYYNYDTEGSRVRKVWVKPGNIIEERVYIGPAEVFTITQGAAVNLRRETLHVTDDKKRIAIVETRTDVLPRETLIRYQYINHLGTAGIETDDAGDIISYEEYYPFGCTSFQSGRSSAEVSLKRYRYTGKERDEESGFYYHGARYYAPWLGRWISPDPAETADGHNLYIYVRNNPVNTHDPTGMWGWREVAVITAVVVVGVAVTVATAGAAGPAIAGFAAGALGAGTTAATVATGVAVGAVAGAAGGLASGVVGEATRQTVNSRALGLGNEEFSGRRIARAGAEGLVAGAVGGAVTGGLGGAAAALRGGAAAARAAGTAAATTRNVSTAARVAAAAGRGARGAVMGAVGSGTGELGRQAVFDDHFDANRALHATLTGAAVGAGLGIANVGSGTIRPSRNAYLRGMSVRAAVQGARARVTGRNYMIADVGTVAGRPTRILATPSGPRAYYQRSGRGTDNPGGAQAGDWSPFEGFSVGGRPRVFLAKDGRQFSPEQFDPVAEGTFVKDRLNFGIRESDPLFKWGSAEAKATGEWVGRQPASEQLRTPKTWQEAQQEVQASGVPTRDPVGGTYFLGGGE